MEIAQWIMFIAAFTLICLLSIDVYFLKEKNKVLKKMIVSEREHIDKCYGFLDENAKAVVILNNRIIEIENFLTSLLKNSKGVPKKEFKH